MRYVFFVLVLLALSACTQGNNPNTPVDITGTDGVVVTAIDREIEVFEGEQFTLTYGLDNQGGSDVGHLQGFGPQTSVRDPGYLILTYDKLYLQPRGVVTSFTPDRLYQTDRNGLGIIQNKHGEFEVQPFWLRGRKPFEVGDESFVTYYFDALGVQRQSDQIDTTVALTACYPYTSNVTHEVCIEQLDSADQGAVICTNNRILPDTVGAPIGVQMTEVRTNRFTDGGQRRVIPSFRITVKNYGRGVPSASECVAVDEPLLNQAWVRAYLLDEPLECGPQVDFQSAGDPYQVRFLRGEAVFSCKLPANADLQAFENIGNYLSLLTINIEYYYRESISTEVTVTR